MAPRTAAGGEWPVGGDHHSRQLAEIQMQLGRLMEANDRAAEDRVAIARENSEMVKRFNVAASDIYDRLREVESTSRDTADNAVEIRRMVHEMKPAVDDYRRMRTVGGTAFVALGVAAAALGIKFSDTARAVFDALWKLIK